MKKLLNGVHFVPCLKHIFPNEEVEYSMKRKRNQIFGCGECEVAQMHNKMPVFFLNKNKICIFCLKLASKKKNPKQMMK